ncbi:MAG: nitronate monooxygenase [Tissierellia bacterium]|nr:nitronate monooxygenase [Tissierellia bacterium]
MFTIQKLFDIQYPIIQGGMANVSDYNLAAAVSKAGGLGVIASGGYSVDEIRDGIHKIREMTNKPFAVNLQLGHPKIDEIIDMVIEEKVEYVIAGGGNPQPYFQRWLDGGLKVIPVVGNTKMAKKVESLGAIACIFEGAEAGGHIAALNTMAVLPGIVDAVSIPVIAAGGITSGRQMLAAEVLGASGVQMGTRFLAAHETNVHEKFKEAVLAAEDKDVVVTGYTGHPVRVLKNEMTDEYLKLEKAGGNTNIDRLMELGTGASRRASQEGDVERGSVMVGQGVGLVTKRESVQEIILTTMSEYETAKTKI